LIKSYPNVDYFFRDEEDLVSARLESDDRYPYNDKHHAVTGATNLEKGGNLDLEIKNSPTRIDDMTKFDRRLPKINKTLNFEDSEKKTQISRISNAKVDETLNFNFEKQLTTIKLNENTILGNTRFKKNMPVIDDMFGDQDDEIILKPNNWERQRKKDSSQKIYQLDTKNGILIIIIKYLELGDNLDEIILHLKLKTTRKFFEKKEKSTIKISILIVDSESYFRKNIIRQVEDYFKRKNNSVDLIIVEACDGLECLTAIHLANNKKIFFDLIISEDPMNFISGRLCSHVLQELLYQNIISEIPMFISTDLRLNTPIQNLSDDVKQSIKQKYANIVKNVYGKPLDNVSFENIMKICDL
jgi:hypothetical protein